MYENIKKNNQIINMNIKTEIVNHFVNGAYIEVKNPVNKEFLVEFWDSNNNCEFRTVVKSNSWAKTNKKYFEEYTCKIYEEGNLIYNEYNNPKGKPVYIA